MSAIYHRNKLYSGFNGLASNVNLEEGITVQQRLDGDKLSQGRNLILFPYRDGMSKTSNGISYIVNDDGSITANGQKTTSTTSQFYFMHNEKGHKLEVGKTYTLSGCPKGGSSTTYRIRLITYNTTESSTVVDQYSDYGNGVTFTIYEGAEYVRIKIDVYGESTVVNNLTFYPMLEEGTIAHAYEPTTESGVTHKNEISEIEDVLNNTGEYTEIAKLTTKSTSTITLQNNAKFSDYKYLYVILYQASDAGVYACKTIPVSIWLAGKWQFYLSFYNGTHYYSYVKCISDTSVSITNASSMVVYIYGIK